MIDMLMAVEINDKVKFETRNGRRFTAEVRDTWHAGLPMTRENRIGLLLERPAYGSIQVKDGKLYHYVHGCPGANDEILSIERVAK
jgi:hypothetical protein